MYNSADLNGTPKDKINALRTELTERQKVANHLIKYGAAARKVDKKYINIAVQNHPDGYPPTADDCESAGIKGYDIGIVVGNNGKIFLYKPSKKGWKESDCIGFHNAIAYQAECADDDGEMISIWIDIMNEEGFKVREVN